MGFRPIVMEVRMGMPEHMTYTQKCVSPILGEFGRNLNDVLPDDLRQELKGLIPSLSGTAGDGWDESRSYMALDWLIRTWLPTWLELSPRCREDARRIRELGRIVDLVSAECAGAIVQVAGRNAAAAGAAGAAAWSAAWSATRAAAWMAAWAAGATVRDAVGAAAWIVARDAARAAARDTARDFLAPTVRVLQLSAIDLLTEMIKNPWSADEVGDPCGPAPFSRDGGQRVPVVFVDPHVAGRISHRGRGAGEVAPAPGTSG